MKCFKVCHTLGIQKHIFKSNFFISFFFSLWKVTKMKKISRWGFVFQMYDEFWRVKWQNFINHKPLYFWAVSDHHYCMNKKSVGFSQLNMGWHWCNEKLFYTPNCMTWKFDQSIFLHILLMKKLNTSPAKWYFWKDIGKCFGSWYI